MAITTVIGDADPLARRLIKTVLEDAGIAVIAEARSATEAVDLVLRHEPDVAVIDAGGAALEGVEATRTLHARRASQPVVVLAVTDDDRTALLALHAGASGFLSKEVEIEELPRALAGVLAGEAAVSRRLALRLIERLRRPPYKAGGLRPIKGELTAREWEILDLLIPGSTNEDVAATLVISTETVRSHVKNIMRKLDVHSRRDALAEAERLRLVAA